MKRKQKDIADATGYSPTVISLAFSGKRKMTWPMAEKFSELYPERTIVEWKKAGVEELNELLEAEANNVP